MQTRRSSPWLIVALLFLVALLNYFDRQSLSVVAPQVQQQLHISDSAYAHIISLFLFASAIAYALSGFVADALGTRRSMSLFVAFWSIAEIATAFVTSAVQLSVTRFLLGLGEPGLWVAAPKAVGEVLEKKNHSLAVGIYTLGATVGAVVAVPIILVMNAHWGWKSVFLVSGVAGVLWVPVWLFFFKNPVAVQRPSGSGGIAALKTLLARSETWQLMIARGMTDPVWYFYLFWFPKYLVTERHLSVDQMARIGWIVYLAAGVGTVVGGWASGVLMRRNTAAGLAYRYTMMGSAVLVVVSPLAFYAPTALLTVCVASVVAMAHMSWLVNLTSMVLQVFPADQVGKAAGLIAAGSAVGGMLSSEVVGYFVTHGGYQPVFVLMACMHPLALLLLWSAFRYRSTQVAI